MTEIFKVNFFIFNFQFLPFPVFTISSFYHFQYLQFPVFTISSFCNFQFSNHFPVFNQTPKSKFNSPVLISLKSFVRRKPIPVFDPRPLCCSSLTTAVGGTTDTNFVDSAHPTVARINIRMFQTPINIKLHCFIPNSECRFTFLYVY